MATFRIVVLKHQKRRDDKYPVSVCVTHLRKKAYIKTGYYVDKSKLSRSFELRDNLILPELLRRIDGYERKFVMLGKKAEKYSSRELADYVCGGKTVDFLDFFRQFYMSLPVKKTTMDGYKTCYSHLERFRASISLLDIDNSFLTAFLSHISAAGAGKRGQQLYLTLLKAVWRAAEKKYRKDTGEFLDSPFDDFVIPDAPVPKKRNISAEKVRALYDYSTTDKRLEFARDAFIVSFLLCGTNMIDLYSLEKPKDERLSYKRTKTRDRRKDEALISYKIEPELLPYLEKYAGKERAFDFSERYQTHDGFNRAVKKWLRLIDGMPDGFCPYYARHSWATIARNRCGVSKDDISACLNHVSVSIFDRKMVADEYIELDYSVIDKANRKVIDFVFYDKNNYIENNPSPSLSS